MIIFVMILQQSYIFKSFSSEKKLEFPGLTFEHFSKEDVNECAQSLKDYQLAVQAQTAENKQKFDADTAAWNARLNQLQSSFNTSWVNWATKCNQPGIDCSDISAFFHQVGNQNLTQGDRCRADTGSGMQKTPSGSEQDCATQCLKNPSCKSYVYSRNDSNFNHKCYLMQNTCTSAGPGDQLLSGYKKTTASFALSPYSDYVKLSIGDAPNRGSPIYNTIPTITVICQDCSQKMDKISATDSEAVLKQTNACVVNMEKELKDAPPTPPPTPPQTPPTPPTPSPSPSPSNTPTTAETSSVSISRNAIIIGVITSVIFLILAAVIFFILNKRK